MKSSLIDQYVEKQSGHGTSTFNGSSVCGGISIHEYSLIGLITIWNGSGGVWHTLVLSISPTIIVLSLIVPIDGSNN